MIYFDDAIFRLQGHGGISTVCENLMTALRKKRVDIFDGRAGTALLEAEDWHVTTYYRTPGYEQQAAGRVVLAYDCIHERYPLIQNVEDAILKARAIREADLVLAISEWTAQDVGTFFPPAHALSIGCGGYIASFHHEDKEEAVLEQMAMNRAVSEFRSRAKLEGDPYVLMVGRRGLYKNARVVYQAWDRWEGAKTHRLVCVGGEPYLTVDDMHFQETTGRGVFIERVSREMLLGAYMGADMLVYPSLFEGFGIPVVEALSFNCPVVCGSDGGLKEAHGGMNIDCDVLSPQSVADAMSKALHTTITDDWEHAVHTQISQHTWERMADRMLAALEIPS